MTTDDLDKYFGSAPLAYKALGRTQQCYQYWKTQGIPLGMQAIIEIELFGRLKAGKQTPARRFRGKK